MQVDGRRRHRLLDVAVVLTCCAGFVVAVVIWAIASPDDAQHPVNGTLTLWGWVVFVLFVVGPAIFGVVRYRRRHKQPHGEWVPDEPRPPPPL